jgi:hypothetical protein
MATTTTSLRTTTWTSTSTWIRAGLVGGAIAGMAFAAAEMMAAVVLNGADAFFMPLRMIAGIALGPSAMGPSTPLLTAAVVGLVIHMALSMMYGAGVAAVLAAVPPLRTSTRNVLALSSLAGFTLWVVNFFLLAHLFGWVWFPDRQNVAVQVMAHTVMFGAVLGVALNRLAFRAVR